jgi:hypothetical protein
VNVRRVLTGIVMFILVVLLVAPVYVLKDISSKATENSPAAQLSAIAKSIAGDTAADDLAAKALTRATRSVVDGKERFRIADGTSCWEIEPTTSDLAYRC